MICWLSKEMLWWTFDVWKDFVCFNVGETSHSTYCAPCHTQHSKVRCSVIWCMCPAMCVSWVMSFNHLESTNLYCEPQFTLLWGGRKILHWVKLKLNFEENGLTHPWVKIMKQHLNQKLLNKWARQACTEGSYTFWPIQIRICYRGISLDVWVARGMCTTGSCGAWVCRASRSTMSTSTGITPLKTRLGPLWMQ